MKFYLQNYNEFKNHVRWHDYFSLSVNEFHIFTFRKYDFFESRGIESVWMVFFFGFSFNVGQKSI